MNSVWLAVPMVLAGIIILRLGGRRAISQMTVGSLLVIISLGTVFANPIVKKGPWATLAIMAIMVATLVVLEWLQLKFNWIERLISGKAIVVIENGVIQTQNLKRLRLSADKLEMRLRQVGVQRISDVQVATIEVNGELGYELKPEAMPLTAGQFERAMQSLIPQIAQMMKGPEPQPSIFEELNDIRKNEIHEERLQ